MTGVDPASAATMDSDVAVIGYGPTGMAMTALLGRAGHRVLVLERYDGLYNLPRAAIFDDETMRTLDKLGMAETMLPLVHPQRNYEWRNGRGQLLLEHSFAAKGKSGWAEWYMMYQPELEAQFDRVCRAESSVEIRHSMPVVGLTQDDDGVTIEMRTPEGATDAVRARYVVACDGGNSFTRRRLDIDQDDYGFSEPWLVCDFELLRPVQIPTALQVGNPAAPTSIISLGPDHHRFSFMLDSAEDFEVERDPELIWARVARYLTPADARLIRAATYTFRSLVAHRWSDGRVLLAGDAAHQMPPFLGQGMCSGIRDAQNLAWKLDLLLTGRGTDDLLDTYQSEREPHVRAVVEKGIELGRLQTTRDPAAAAARDKRMLAQRAAHQAPEKIRFPGLGPGFHARQSALGRGELFLQADVATDAGPQRFDEALGRGFFLLLTPERAGEVDAAALQRAGVGVVEVSDELDVEGAYTRWLTDHGCSAVVVRPDFYVYGCADDAAATNDLVEQLLADLGATAMAGASS